MKYEKELVLFTLFAMNLLDQPAPEVTIEQGIVSGKISGDGSIFEYIGIPYATTNSSNRFQAPLPPPSWTGVYKAIDEMYQCPQLLTLGGPQSFPFGTLGTEDCLKINVYVPVGTKKPLPVMVYIHGGAFIFGNGGKLVYASDFLVKHDVILVTFNYRLGILGFLCLGVKEAPGNAGMKDQVAALKWVKKNIAAFGGDPDNVTIFGQSAGGTSVSLLMASHVTEGLFNRAILQSGSAISNWGYNQDPVKVASYIAKELGYNTKDPLEIYEIFSKMSTSELTSFTKNHHLSKLFPLNLMILPCVEKEIPGVESFLTDVPYNLLSKSSKNISVIYGSTNNEGLFFVSGENEKTLEDWNNRNLVTFDLNLNSKEKEMEIDIKLREHYFGNERIKVNTIMNLSNYNGELYFEIPVILEPEMILRKSNSPIYNYYFKYSGGRNLVKLVNYFTAETGACHGDDLFYLFKSVVWPFWINKEDQKVIDWMTTMWTNFAKYGNPTPDTENKIPVKWMPSSKEKLNFLYIDNELKMGPIPKPQSYQLWKNIYDKYRLTKLN